MSKVLLLSLVFAPDGVSTAVLMTELALDLKALGHEITVLTTTPHYNIEPEARAHQPLRSRWPGLLYHSDCQGVSVFHASVPVKGARVGARLMDYLRFHFVSTLAGLTLAGKFDIILASSPPLTIGLSAWILGLMRRAPFVYIVQEIYPDIAVRIGVLKNGPVIAILEQMERFIYARAQMVSVISEWFRRRLVSKGVPLHKMRLIPNFVDTVFMQPGPRRNAFSATYGLDDKFVVLYAGNIGMTQGFETILEAAARLSDLADIRFVFVGDGVRRRWLTESLQQNGPENAIWLPYQPRSVVPQVYAASDLCLVPLQAGAAQETFPSKVYTVMAAGRAVLVAADSDSELTWVVEQARCGFAVPPDNAAELASAIRHVYHERGRLVTMGRNGRDYVVANHARHTIARQYDSLIREMANGG